MFADTRPMAGSRHNRQVNQRTPCRSSCEPQCGRAAYDILNFNPTGTSRTRRSHPANPNRPAKGRWLDPAAVLQNDDLALRDETPRRTPRRLHQRPPIVRADESRRLARANRPARLAILQQRKNRRLEFRIHRVPLPTAAGVGTKLHVRPILLPLLPPAKRPAAGRANL